MVPDFPIGRAQVLPNLFRQIFVPLTEFIAIEERRGAEAIVWSRQQLDRTVIKFHLQAIPLRSEIVGVIENHVDAVGFMKVD